mgnify:CR=1 FL=1
MMNKELIAKMEQMIQDRERFIEMLENFSSCLGVGDLEYSQMSLSALVKISQAHTQDLQYVLGKMKEAK